MKNFFRLIVLTLVGVAVLLSPGTIVFAQSKDYGLKKTVAATGNLLPQKIGGAENVPQLIGTIVSAVLGFLGIIFFCLIGYAGLIWMTAQGSEEKIERAKDTISGAVIGLVIVLAAYAFTQFVFDQLAARSSSNANATSAGTTGGKKGVICQTLTTEALCVDVNNEPLCGWVEPSASNVGGCSDADLQ